MITSSLHAKTLARAAARARTRAADIASPTSATPPVASAADNPQRVTVDVLMAYTQSVLTTLSGQARADALQSAFDAEIAKTNAAFATSQIMLMVPITPGGLGTVDALMISLLQSTGASAGAATAADLVWRAASYVPQIIVGIIALVLWFRKANRAFATAK